MNHTVPRPAPTGKRYGDYAERLFDDPVVRPAQDPLGRPAGYRRRPAAAALGVARRRAVARRERRSPAKLVVAAALGLGLVMLLYGAGTPGSLAEQRPNPWDYRGEVDLVSIDRVGTMFCAVVSQGFFLEERSERRRGLERLVRRIHSEGYGALYLAEASGRTVAWWNGRALQVVPDSDLGS